MNTASKVLLLLYVFKLSRAEECDVRIWYLEMTKNGVFDGELSAEQLFLQKTINEMVLSSKKDSSKRKVNCDVLEMYEEMLKPDEEEDSSDKQDGNEGENESKSSKEEQSKEDTALLVDKVNDNETKTISDVSEETADQLVSEGTELHSSKEADETDTTEKVSDVNEEADETDTTEKVSDVNEEADETDTTEKVSDVNEEADETDTTEKVSDVNEEADETDTTEADQMEADETELFSDDSNDDEEEKVEIEKIDTIEEEIVSDFSSNSLDKLEDEETIVSSIDLLEETISIDDDRPVENAPRVFSQ
ncbi:dentin sialophosphoprotein-like [Pecten maximus]|uniref:dentin sialophosphoprotein-like n=1 Tax=Pecten maximus TaxID=6579 RepID=UPI0014587FF0|nr:dentin sialophosphoprotein-like [Pecten maximus]